MANRKPSRTKEPQPRPRVLLAMHQGSFCRGVLAGIADYAHSAGPWTILLHESRLDLEALDRYRPIDGLISVSCRQEVAARLRRDDIPAVSVEATSDDFPQVIPDDRAIGRMAADHFHDLGLTRAAYLSDLPAPFSRSRREGFDLRCEHWGIDLEPAFESTGPRSGDLDELTHWLEKLPKPVGIFAGHSGPARLAMAQLFMLGIDVPNEAALLTVELLHLESRLSFPAISSIDIATQRIGYLAARMLAELMAGGKPASGPVLVEPRRVRCKGSTDVLQVHDHPLSQALRFIRTHACDGIGVDDVLEQVTISRRSLEMRFRKYLGRTIHKEIVRVRLEEAKRLLAETQLPLPDIAVRVGYEFSSNLCDVFRRELGAPPSQFRSEAGTRPLF